jgi:antitoxin component YwqK of YwqJK toxin-antitoxin module
MIVQILDFNLNMQNGKWICEKVLNGKPKKPNQTIEVRGEFKDSLREGLFESYHIQYRWGKKVIVKNYSISYKNDLLDGHLIIYSPNGKKSIECTYVKGIAHGYYISYSGKGGLNEIIYFNNGKITNWVIFDKLNENILCQGYGENTYLKEILSK